MLSIFPELLSFELLGIFIIRFVVGAVLFYLALEILFEKKGLIINKLKMQKGLWKYSIWIFSLTAMIISGFMMIGFLTQVSALVSTYLFLNLLVIDKDQEILYQSKIFYIVLALISLSFLFIGPGMWSIDLPL